MTEKKNTFKFGGIDIEVLDQKSDYVPTFTNPIKLAKEFEQSIATAIKLDLPALLVGETGTGKTSIVRELAYMRKQGYTRINMNGYTTPDELIGSKSVKNGATYYEDGILTKAMKEGHIVVLDEINATPPDCSFILHGLLDDDKRVALPNGDIISPHSDFRIFATMNPEYEGTRSLNRAFLDRFSVILNFEIPTPAKEKAIVTERAGVSEEIADKMVTLAHMGRAAYREGKTLTFVSTRSLLQWGRLIVEGGMDMKAAYSACIANKARADEQGAFMEFYNAVFKTKAEEQPDAVILTSKRQLDQMAKQIDELELQNKTKARDILTARTEKDGAVKAAKEWEDAARQSLELNKQLQETLEKMGKVSAVQSAHTAKAEEGLVVPHPTTKDDMIQMVKAEDVDTIRPSGESEEAE